MARLLFMLCGVMCWGSTYCQEKFLSVRDVMIDSLHLCNADERTVASLWGVPYKVSYGQSPVSTIGGGIDDTMLTSTVFYYSGCLLYFYTYEVSQWIYMASLTGKERTLYVDAGKGFNVGDSLSAVLMGMKDYITPSISRRLQRDKSSVTFHTVIDEDVEDCPMTGEITFIANDEGIVTEIKIGMVKNR